MQNCYSGLSTQRPPDNTRRAERYASMYGGQPMIMDRNMPTSVAAVVVPIWTTTICL